MNGPHQFSEDVREFIKSCHWTFAKTYAATWPHEYIVRERVDEGLFVKLVGHIREHGYEGSFYTKRITYFDEEGMVYWTMGAPIEGTIIVNRCTKEQTYEYRLQCGTIPDPNKEPPRSSGPVLCIPIQAKESEQSRKRINKQTNTSPNP